MLKARQQTQARFESFLQDAVAEDRCEVSICLILIIILETQNNKTTRFKTCLPCAWVF